MTGKINIIFTKMKQSKTQIRKLPCIYHYSVKSNYTLLDEKSYAIRVDCHRFNRKSACDIYTNAEFT